MKFTNRKRPFITIVMLTFATIACARKEEIGNFADISHLAAYFVAALMIGFFIMVFTNRVLYFRLKDINFKTRQLNTQLALVLDANKTQVWTYNNDKRIFALLSNHGEQQNTYNAIDFSSFYDHDDFSAMMRQMNAVIRGQQESCIQTVKEKKPQKEDRPQRIYEIEISLLHRHHQDDKILLGIQRDITDDKIRKEKASNLALRYHTVFNSSLVDMVYYDADGIMTDINEKACETFEVEDKEKLLATKPHLNDVPAMQDIDIRNIEQFHSSSITAINDINRPIGGLKGPNWDSDKTYYEQIISPIHDEDGKLAGIVMAGRNITEMVESQHHQKWAGQQLKMKTKDIQAYIENINYSLRVSNVRLINYYPDTHELEISSDLNKPEYRLPQLRCITLLQHYNRRKARGLFRRMDRRYPSTISTTMHTLFRDQQGRDIYLNFSLVPVTGKDGKISHYFGMCQNNTDMVYTENKLREETLKAQETEALKDTFLTNMSHEIRTPLNAVIGFAELFNSPHDDADEPVFAEEIKRNTGELLQLVNDILFISRLDAKMVEFNYKDCDFALIFDGLCYLGWSAVNPKVKVFVENPYNHLIINIDEKNLGIVLQKLCSHAAQHTEEGTIRAKYEYRHGELSISIEDTGYGLTKEQQTRIFERFARNELVNQHATGLDMPIIKEIIEQMGGTLEIQSEPSKGNTVYIIIPCEMSSMEKKIEII